MSLRKVRIPPVRVEMAAGETETTSAIGALDGPATAKSFVSFGGRVTMIGFKRESSSPKANAVIVTPPES